MRAFSLSGCRKFYFVIVFLIGNELHANGAPWLPYLAESSAPSSMVNISVVDMAVDIEHCLLLLCRNEWPQIVYCNKSGVWLVAMKDMLRHRNLRFICINDSLIFITKLIRQPLRICCCLPIDPYSSVICWSKAEIFDCEQNEILVDMDNRTIKWAIIRVAKASALEGDVLNPDVGSQLLFRSIVRASYQSSGGQPQRNSGKEQQGSEEGNQSVGDFKPIAHERRPKFGSLLFAICAIIASFIIAARGQDIEFGGRRIVGRLITAAAVGLGLWGIVGVLLGVDPVSILSGG